MWLRLDVDHASSSKFWNVIRFTTGMKIPNYLDHVKETLRFLEQYNVPQIWFFRRWTCPDSFPEAFGAHITRPEDAWKDINTVQKKLGDFKFFTRHGYARLKSGRLWTPHEIEFVEQEYGLKDLSGLPHLTITRNRLEDLKPSEIDHILFHPCHIYREKEQLTSFLKAFNGKISILL